MAWEATVTSEATRGEYGTATAADFHPAGSDDGCMLTDTNSARANTHSCKRTGCLYAASRRRFSASHEHNAAGSRQP
jgi:hypothetical protein